MLNSVCIIWGTGHLESINKLIEIAELTPAGNLFEYNPAYYMSEGYSETFILNKLASWKALTYEEGEMGSVFISASLEKLRDIKNSLDQVKSSNNNELPTSLYIKEDIFNLIKDKKDGFKYTKLLNLLNELNKNYLNSNVYSCLALIRAITDHIPPLLGYGTFEQVVNNYKWSTTDKQYIIKLFDDRPISDDSLHRTISTSNDLIDMTNIPNNQFLNRLLQECLEKTVQPGIKHNEDVKLKDEIHTKKITQELRPIVRAELLSTTGGPNGYSINFLIRNVGKGLALLKDFKLGDVQVQISSISLAENEKYETTLNLTETKLRKGELHNPEVVINYDNIDSNKFQTTYKINLELRADGLFNLQSFTDPKFSQIS